MSERLFNLLDEPWILAIDLNGIEVKLSLKEIFSKAHLLKSLSGEMPSQDVAILRLLLGVCHAVFKDEDLKDISDALDLWKRLWEQKKFPEKVIDYLQEYHERFWFVHPIHPFYQVAEMEKGTKYPISKLIGEVSEGNNKARLFSSRNGEAKLRIEFAEAVRWLIHFNAFDDASVKKTKSDMPSMGPGWVGTLGVVYAVGVNLFETIMLNFSLADGDGNLWDNGQAVWEKEIPNKDERVEIALPYSQAELLTLQSRLIMLLREGEFITGFKLLGGEFFQEENAFTEQMTLWRLDKGDKGAPDVYKPKRYAGAKQFWRNFSALFSKFDGAKQPGVVSWLTQLEYDGVIESLPLQFYTLSTHYGSMSSVIEDMWGDGITVNADLLSKLGDDWVIYISKLLEITDALVSKLGNLAVDIGRATGATDGVSRSSLKKEKLKRSLAKEEIYFRLDIPFRTWLAELNSYDLQMEDRGRVWLMVVREFIFQMAEELVSQAGVSVLKGREVSISKDKKVLITAPGAVVKYKKDVNFKLREEGYL